MNKVNEILDLPFQHQYPRNKSEDIIHKTCARLQSKQRYVTSRSLANEIGRTQHRTKKVISNLVKRGLLVVKFSKRGSNGAKYVISKTN